MSFTLPWDELPKKKEESDAGGLEPIPGSSMHLECNHPSHNPPTMIRIPPGHQWRHICPGCGKQVVLRPVQISC